MMKMPVNIEYLESLPKRERSKDRDLLEKINRRYYRDSQRSFGKRSPYFTAVKVIDNNIGKPFNDAFSYYCKHVIKYDQHIFKSYFADFNNRYENYFIDDEGLIQENPRYVNKPKIENRTYQSEDYETKLVHKETGHSRLQFVPVEIIVGYKETTRLKYKPTSPYNNKRHYVNKLITVPIKKQIGWEYNKHESKWPPHDIPKYQRYFAKDSDFIDVVVKGEKIIFDSPNDWRLKRLRTEKVKRLETKYELKYKSDSSNWDFVLKQGKQRLDKILEDKLLSDKEMKAKLKLENDIKIVANGFDLETSFRTQQKFTR